MAQQKILIDNQKKKKIATPVIRKKTKQILDALGFSAHEVSIVITDDAQIQHLNNAYRNINKTTNVLAFPMQEGEFSQITPGLLGDVVISFDTALNEAQTAQITLEERISQLLVHGILHLAGFDHEIDESSAQKMENKSLELIRQIETNTDLNFF